MQHEAIYNLYPNVSHINSDGDNLTAFDSENNEVIVDGVTVQAEVTRLQAEYDSLQYARDRAAAYPSLQDQADMQYWDAVNGTTTWQDAIKAVKDQFPKPE